MRGKGEAGFGRNPSLGGEGGAWGCFLCAARTRTTSCPGYQANQASIGLRRFAEPRPEVAGYR